MSGRWDNVAMLDALIILQGNDKAPEPNDVTAGPLGFAVWVFLILAVVAIGFSLSKQLRKAQAAKDAGVFGDEPIDRDAETSTPEER